MTVFFTDLDRTLIYSASTLELRVPDNQAPRLVCVETRKGRPASFVTEAAAAGIRRLLESQLLVPVTTRSVEQYQRVRLPGPTPRLALVANGGRLLRNGTVDENYSRETARLLEGSTPLEVVLAHLTSVADPCFSIRIRSVEGLFCYAVIESDAVPPGWTVELADYAASVGWEVSDQGRKVYLLPNDLSKGQAAQRIAEELNLEGFIAAGDSSTDEPMLAKAAEVLIPRHSALAQRATESGARITQSDGVMAGEEAVIWAEAQLLGSRRTDWTSKS